MKNKEMRVHSAEIRSIKDDEAGLRFSGYAAKFNSMSEDLGGFRELIAPGAFAESVGKDDIRALFNHDPNYVLGRNRAGTLALREDETGLAFEVTAPDTQWARDLAESVNRGDVNQCSFGFYTLSDDWKLENGEHIRTLEKCELFDVSIVTYPAYTATEAGVRSAKDIFAEHAAAMQGQDGAKEAQGRGAIMDKKLKLKERELF